MAVTLADANETLAVAGAAAIATRIALGIGAVGPASAAVASAYVTGPTGDKEPVATPVAVAVMVASVARVAVPETVAVAVAVTVADVAKITVPTVTPAPDAVTFAISARATVPVDGAVAVAAMVTIALVIDPVAVATDWPTANAVIEAKLTATEAVAVPNADATVTRFVYVAAP